MKTFRLFLIAILFLGISCNQKDKASKTNLRTIPKSGELFFGDKKVTYSIEGEGMPCFVCADGDLQKDCISDELKKHFQFVFIEQRHSSIYEEPKDYSNITMDTIVNDLEVLRTKLGFDKIYVLGHSIIGLMALEYARKYPEKTNGVILINTCPNFNSGYMNFTNNYWKENASEERKEIYNTNKLNLNKLNKDSIPPDEFLYLSYKAEVPKNYYNPLYENVPHFRYNNDGWNHFYSLMRNYDITSSEIELPVFLSLSNFDFAVPSILWNDYKNKMPTISIFNFEESGHYPHIEEQELFDKLLLNWIDENK